MDNGFFAMVSRMKYINRWALMRNEHSENLCEHSFEVAVIAHALAVIGNKVDIKRVQISRHIIFLKLCFIIRPPYSSHVSSTVISL